MLTTIEAPMTMFENDGFYGREGSRIWIKKTKTDGQQLLHTKREKQMIEQFSYSNLFSLASTIIEASCKSANQTQVVAHS